MKEARNIRRLAQEVLLQRSDVETFFVSSLQYVRKQLEHEVAEQSTPPSGMDGHFSPGKKGKQQVDISQLNWHERECVLRLAFAKINNQAQNAHLCGLPKHSFSEVQAGQLRAAAQLMPVEKLSGLVSGAGKPQLA
jgi:hypothetical protein